MKTTTASPRRWHWIITAVAAFMAFLIGFTLAASSNAAPESFVPSVQDAYPETDGQAEDILGYGYAVCAGLDDGRSEAQVARWLSDVPHDHLGIDGDADQFGERIVDLAVEKLCGDQS